MILAFVEEVALTTRHRDWTHKRCAPEQCIHERKCLVGRTRRLGRIQQPALAPPRAIQRIPHRTDQPVSPGARIEADGIVCLIGCKG